MTSANLKSANPTLAKAEPQLPAFVVDGRRGLAVRAGSTFSFANGGSVGFEKDFPIVLPDLTPGCDYYIHIDAANDPVATLADGLPGEGIVGGFHFAPGGNATARSGGDSEPAINPYSCWDLNYRPACPDPRGMALVDMPDGTRVWVDIYKLNINHLAGTSRFGVTIADGVDLPLRIDGNGHCNALDYQTTVDILTHHGKQLLSYDEFRVAAFGVTEKTSADRDPITTGLDAARTSQRGIMQATGNLWDWGHDGDPESPRASLFGGSWLSGSSAGSRCAGLGYWPGYSLGNISARGRSDHLQPA